MSDKIQLINDLFSKITCYEEGASPFRTNEFIENFNGVISLFPAVRDKVNEIREVDQILSNRSQEFNINRSDLRQICVHLLTMFFKFSANAPSPYDRCYLSSREKRRPHKDAGFITEILTPLVFSPGGFHKDFELKYYFLKQLNEFQRKFGEEGRYMIPFRWRRLGSFPAIFYSPIWWKDMNRTLPGCIKKE